MDNELLFVYDGAVWYQAMVSLERYSGPSRTLTVDGRHGTMADDLRNMFCRVDDLDNEASVERNMLDRLLSELGYRDSQIATKKSIDEITVGQGRRRVPFRPDYVMSYRRTPRWVLDAKSTTEDIDKWVSQCQSYCLALNSRQSSNPVKYFMLSNGLRTKVFRWDNEIPLLELDFQDFNPGSKKWESLKRMLAPRAFSSRGDKTAEAAAARTITLQKASPSAINKAFSSAHGYIYKHEQLSYSAAFMEFVKLIFLKMTSDKQAHASANAHLDARGDLVVPADDVHFSTSWVAALTQTGVSNPVDSVLFANLTSDFELLISQHKKKRIFDKGEHINLKASTILEIVRRFERIDLYTMDEDLNGRMFETFLNATLRGKALGQYFTPRSIVKMAVGLANLQVSRTHADKVLDGCCGTGGFLIAALAYMWHRVEENASLSPQEKAEAKAAIAENDIWGVDAARDPKLARIARMNMFLHGDGGSRIYQLDTLDKDMTEHPDTEGLELRSEKAEFRDAVSEGDFFDVVLTNPPFATEYRATEASERGILKRYDIANHHDDKTGRNTLRPSLRSSVLFLERYYDLLKPGGKLITVIDDGVLGGSDYSYVRDWLRSHFLIRAVVSLPGDAFQRSQARVKTSILMMEKRDPSRRQEQPPVFMWYCSHVGLDDPNRERVIPSDVHLAAEAEKEIREVVGAYQKFLQGDTEVAAAHSVPAVKIGDRLDVKAVLPKTGRNRSEWERMGLSALSLGELAKPAFLGGSRSEDVIATHKASLEDKVCFAKVRYDGTVVRGDEIYAVDSSASKLYRLHAGDLVLSNINAINGAIGVVPKELDGLVVTNEYTVLQSNGILGIEVLWALLRSAGARADMILLTTGIGRTRISWDDISGLTLPIVDRDHIVEIEKAMSEIKEAEERARNLRERINGLVASELHMEDSTSQEILQAFKPPR